MTRPLAYFDMEIFPNYCLVAFMLEDGRRMRWAAYDAKERMAGHEIVQFVKQHTLISFNGIGFDIPLLMLAIRKEPVSVIKKGANRIIVDGLKWWNFEKEFQVKCQRPEIDHIDLMEVAPLSGSLKLYAAKCHSFSIQDLPVDPMNDLTPQQMAEVEEYCFNDLLNTRDLYHALKVQIAMRETVGKRYGLDLRSKSDAQMAEAIIKSYVEKIKREKVQRPQDLSGMTFRYQIPEWMQFWEIDILDDIRQATFEVSDKGKVMFPDTMKTPYRARVRNSDGTTSEVVKYKEREIVYRGKVYRIGLGGLHSSEKKVVVYADQETMIIDIDVAGYYPRIVLNEKIYPAHIGPVYLEVCRILVDERLATKKRVGELKKLLLTTRDQSSIQRELGLIEPVGDGLKITVNGGTFGKLGDKYSVLYSPSSLIQVTITGQLAVLMLIEAFGFLEGVEVISANTDGLTIRCPFAQREQVAQEIQQWEETTGFTMEQTNYRAMFIRDVNNYIAIKEDGQPKCKGDYGDGLPLHKNPWFKICADAVVDYVMFGVSIEETIRQCNDIRKFVAVIKVTGGAKFQDRPIGRVVRWYQSTESTDDIRYILNNKLVQQTTGAKPLIELPFELPDDLNYDWYIREAKSMVWDLGLDVDGERAPEKPKKSRRKIAL